MKPPTKEELRNKITAQEVKIKHLTKMLALEKAISSKYFDVAVQISSEHMKDIENHFKRDESDDDSMSDNDDEQ
jgi:hypothetical protein